MDENDISYKIRGAIYEVYNTLGPGLLESVYVEALVFELERSGLKARKEVPVPVFYKGKTLRLGYRIDILIENKVIVEVKSVESLSKVHHKQVLTYLRITGLKLAILVNFNEEKIESGIFRKVNNL